MQVSSHRVYTGRVINLDVDTVRYPDGSTGELEMIRHPGAAAVIPFASDPARRVEEDPAARARGRDPLRLRPGRARPHDSPAAAVPLRYRRHAVGDPGRPPRARRGAAGLRAA